MFKPNIWRISRTEMLVFFFEEGVMLFMRITPVSTVQPFIEVLFGNPNLASFPDAAEVILPHQRISRRAADAQNILNLQDCIGPFLTGNIHLSRLQGNRHMIH